MSLAASAVRLQPIAWRIFEENLFARGRKETWAELFFVDEKDCVSSIMVNNTTLEELRKLAENLFYDDIKLSDIVLTIKPEKAENEREGQKRTWYIAGPPVRTVFVSVGRPRKGEGVKRIRP